MGLPCVIRTPAGGGCASNERPQLDRVGSSRTARQQSSAGAWARSPTLEWSVAAPPSHGRVPTYSHWMIVGVTRVPSDTTVLAESTMFKLSPVPPSMVPPPPPRNAWHTEKNTSP